MRNIKIILGIVILTILIFVIVVYVYIGTYIFPIAPYWVTQLPPNPPAPVIKHAEIHFELTYEILGGKKAVTDILICDFDGFEVTSVGGPKRRKWKEYYRNVQNNEVFTFRNEPSQNTKVVLENIGSYKIILGVGSAEYFLGEPEYKGIPELPTIKVYDTETGYYEDPNQGEKFLEQYNFQIISWQCDEPIKNIFK